MAIISTTYALETLVLLVAAAYLLYKFSMRNYDYWQKRGVQSPKPLPFLGNFLEIFTFRITIGHYLAKLYNQFKAPYFGIYILNKPHLVIKDPELIKAILVKDFNYFFDRTILSDEKCDPMFSQILFTVKNPEWKFMRTKMTPVFTSGKMKSMLALVNEVAEEMTEHFNRNIDKVSFETKEVCAKYATDVIATCVFGIKANSFQNEDAEFRQVGRKMFDFNWKLAMRQTAYFMAPSLVQFFKLPFFDLSLTNFLRDAFWSTINEREKTKQKRNDLVDIMIQMKNNSLPDDEIKFEGDRVVAQALIFFAAGFETTSATMSFALYELCIQPKIQKRLRLEIKSVLAKHGGFTYEAILDMTYLHMVLCETLRKYPVLPFLDRECAADYKLPNSDLVIEKGTPVYIPMFGLHYDPEYFPDPEKFDPERFSEENKSKLACFTYLPFGEGPRNCIGERFGLMVAKSGLAHLLIEYEMEANSSTPIPLEFATKSFLVASKVGLPMNIKKIVSKAA